MRKSLLALAIMVFLAPAALARADQNNLSGEPGYIDLNSFKTFDRGKSVVEISLTQPLLSLARWAVVDDDPEMAEMLGGLKLLQVNVFSYPVSEGKNLASSLEDITSKLATQGWNSVVKVKQKNESWHIMVKMDEKGGTKGAPLLNGVAILGMGDEDSDIHYEDGDGLEAVFVNVVGNLDFAQLSKLGKHFDLPMLEKLDAKDAGKAQGDDH